MPTSRFSDIMNTVGVPALFRVFGIAVTRTNADGDESPVLVVLAETAEPVGDYGERFEQRWTLEIAANTGAVVGDTFTEPGTVTPDDRYPDDVVWTAAQLISDDGYTRKFAVRKGTA